MRHKHSAATTLACDCRDRAARAPRCRRPAVRRSRRRQWDPTLPRLSAPARRVIPSRSPTRRFQATAAGHSNHAESGPAVPEQSGARRHDHRRRRPRARGARAAQAIEYVIRRGGSQMGVPYSWGGGKPTGPTTGVDSGANTVGFDCSGLTQFSFAGVGVLIPSSPATSTTPGARCRYRRPSGATCCSRVPAAASTSRCIWAAVRCLRPRECGQGHRESGPARRAAALRRPDDRILSGA